LFLREAHNREHIAPGVEAKSGLREGRRERVDSIKKRVPDASNGRKTKRVPGN